MFNYSLIAGAIVLLAATISAAFLWLSRPVDFGLRERNLVIVGTDDVVVYCPPQGNSSTQTPIIGCVKSRRPPLVRIESTLTGRLHNQILHFKNLFVGAMGAIDAFMAQLQKVPNKTMRAAFRVMERGARQHLPCLDDPELGPTYLTFSGYQCVPCPALDLWEEQHGIEPHPNALRLLVECAGSYFKNPALDMAGVTYYDTIQPYTQVAE